MRLAYLTDCDGVGGGMEYIRRQIAAHSGDETRIFFSCRGECASEKINAWHADVFHVNHLKALAQLFRNPLAKPRGKVVFTVHGIHLRKYDFLPKTMANRLKRWLRLSLERMLYWRCDELIALTETDAADIQRLYGPGLRVIIEPNAVDVAEFTKPVGGLRYKLDEFAFVCIARFDFQKGQDILLRAMSSTQTDLRSGGKRMLMIGGGSTLAKAKTYAANAGISDLVEFAGEIPNAGMYMTCAKVLVAPSRWEGMPYLLLEAIARDRKIIASDCAGNRDVLKDYDNAVLFPVEDSDRLAELMVENVA